MTVMTLLGKTGLKVNRAGFGCYRISDTQESHRKALLHAIENGITLIDTSTNYTDGHSEKLVGQVLAALAPEKRNEITVVTKAGYLQGHNLDSARKKKIEGTGYPEVVEYTEDLWHCIHPQFLEDQITDSLKRLQLKTLDVFLLHNPEYFLKSLAPDVRTSEQAQSVYYDRLVQAFEHLTKERARGRIRWYGISSNTFTAQREQTDFTSLERLLENLKTRSQELGTDLIAGFGVIQFPMNLFEMGALNNPGGNSLLEVARLAEIGTLVNRPLNAFVGNSLRRLADFSHSCAGDLTKTLEQAFEKALKLEQVANENPDQNVRWAHRLRQELSQNTSRLRELDTWRWVKEYQITPALTHTSPEYQATLDTLLTAIDSMVEDDAARESKRLQQFLSNRSVKLKSTPRLSQQALRVLWSVPGIDCVLIGMRREAYVDDVIQALQAHVLSPLNPDETHELLEDLQGELLEDSIDSDLKTV